MSDLIRREAVAVAIWAADGHGFHDQVAGERTLRTFQHLPKLYQERWLRLADAAILAMRDSSHE